MYRQVAVAETSSFRYIGIQPPLPKAAVDTLLEQLVVPDWAAKLGWQQQCEVDVPYTELYVDVGEALDLMGEEVINKGSLQLAHMVARILESMGDEAEVLAHILPTDFEHPIFGVEANQMREAMPHMQ